MTDDSSLKDTIIPKSDQLNADDLLCGPITVMVESVKRGGSKEQPVEVAISGGHKPYFPCKSMRRVLIMAWGERGSGWVGRSMTLYRDPDVKWGGVCVGGIRISHLSDIDSQSFMLTVSKSKREGYAVKRLELTAYPEAKFNELLPTWQKAVASGKETVESLLAKLETKGVLSGEQRETIASLGGVR